MLRMQVCVAAAVSCTAIPLSSTCSAHGLWFAPRSDKLAMVFGLGGQDMDTVSRLPDLINVTGFAAGWKPIPAKIAPMGLLSVVDSDPTLAAICASLDGGTWTMDKSLGKYVHTARDQVKNPGPSDRDLKYAVFLQKLDQRIPLLAQQKLQIIPAGPLPLTSGAPLQIKVYFNGKPVTGVEILSDYVGDVDAAPILTDRDGKVTIHVRNQGLNVIGATLTTPTDNPKKYDKLEYVATLSFVLPQEAE